MRDLVSRLNGVGVACPFFQSTLVIETVNKIPGQLVVMRNGSSETSALLFGRYVRSNYFRIAACILVQRGIRILYGHA